MTRIPTKPATILGAIKSRLVASGAFTDANCLVAQAEQEWRNPPGQTWATIWFDGGTPDLENADGGIPIVNSSITITLWTCIKSDKAGEDTKLVTDAARGLLPLADKVFQSLWLHDLLDDSDDEILAEPLRPTGLSSPVRIPGQPASIAITMQCLFEWAVDPAEED